MGIAQQLLQRNALSTASRPLTNGKASATNRQSQTAGAQNQAKASQQATVTPILPSPRGLTQRPANTYDDWSDPFTQRNLDKNPQGGFFQAEHPPQTIRSNTQLGYQANSNIDKTNNQLSKGFLANSMFSTQTFSEKPSQPSPTDSLNLSASEAFKPGQNITESRHHKSSPPPNPTEILDNAVNNRLNNGTTSQAESSTTLIKADQTQSSSMQPDNGSLNLSADQKAVKQRSNGAKISASNQKPTASESASALSTAGYTTVQSSSQANEPPQNRSRGELLSPFDTSGSLGNLEKIQNALTRQIKRAAEKFHKANQAAADDSLAQAKIQDQIQAQIRNQALTPLGAQTSQQRTRGKANPQIHIGAVHIEVINSPPRQPVQSAAARPNNRMSQRKTQGGPRLSNARLGLGQL